MSKYGTDRKTGVGFNAPMVLEGRMRHDWRKYYALMRRIVCIRKPHGTKPSSLIEALREYRR